MSQTVIYVAEVHTRNFTFTSIDVTAALSLKALKKTWEMHAVKTGASITWDELKSDVYVSERKLGQGWTA